MAQLQLLYVVQPQEVSHRYLPPLYIYINMYICFFFFLVLIVSVIEIKASRFFQWKQKLSLSLNFTDSCFSFIAQWRDERGCML